MYYVFNFIIKLTVITKIMFFNDEIFEIIIATNKFYPKIFMKNCFQVHLNLFKHCHFLTNLKHYLAHEYYYLDY